MNFILGPILPRKEEKPDFTGAFILCCLAILSYGLASYGENSKTTYLTHYGDVLDGLYPMSRTISRQLQRDFSTSIDREVGAQENLIWFWIEDRLSKEKSNVVYFFPTEKNSKAACGHCDYGAYYTRALLPSLPSQTESLTIKQVKSLIESSRCFQHNGKASHRFGLPRKLSPDYETQKNVHCRLHSVQKMKEGATIQFLLTAGTSAFQSDPREPRPNIKQLKVTVELPGGIHVQESL